MTKHRSKRVLTFEGHTGTPQEIAKALGISKQEMYKIFNEMGGVKALAERVEYKEAVEPQPKTRECRGCGNHFHPAACSTRYCSPECKPKQIYIPTPRQPVEYTCLECGTAGFTVGNGTKYCSDRCQDRAATKRAAQKRIEVHPPCLCCGALYTPKLTHERYCSDKCRATVKRRLKKAREQRRPRKIWQTEEEGRCATCDGPLPIPRPIPQKVCCHKCRRTHDHRRRWELQSANSKWHSRMTGRIADMLLLRGRGRNDGYVDKYLGCTRLELVARFESLFTPEMHWGNYGVFGWQIDHIIPGSWFNLELEEHRHVCFHHKNMRPLWCVENYTRQKTMRDEDKANLDPVLREAARALGLDV